MFIHEDGVKRYGHIKWGIAIRYILAVIGLLLLSKQPNKWDVNQCTVWKSWTIAEILGTYTVEIGI